MSANVYVRRRRMSRVATCRAFTLIELLVVVAIIALLIAILLPSLARAREQAKSTACLSNLHQFTLAAQTFAHENKGKVPRGGDPDKRDHWIFGAVRQMGDRKAYQNVNQIQVPEYPVFQCPTRNKTHDRPFLDYVINDLDADWSPVPSPGHALTGLRGVGKATNPDAWQMPAEVAYIVDAAREDTENVDDGSGAAGPAPSLRGGRDNWYNGVTSATVAGVDAYDLWLPHHLPTEKPISGNTPTMRASRIMHLGTVANYLYVDGHAKPLRPYTQASSATLAGSGSLAVKEAKRWLKTYGIRKWNDLTSITPLQK